jgi:hypothetical protein
VFFLFWFFDGPVGSDGSDTLRMQPVLFIEVIKVF